MIIICYNENNIINKILLINIYIYIYIYIYITSLKIRELILLIKTLFDNIFNSQND